MPRQNRLEVTPPPAHAHWGQTKAHIKVQGAGRGVTKQGNVMHRKGTYFTHLVKAKHASACL